MNMSPLGSGSVASREQSRAPFFSSAAAVVTRHRGYSCACLGRASLRRDLPDDWFYSLAETSSPYLLRDVIRRAHGERQQGQRGIFLGGGNERGAVHHEKVLDLVRLVELGDKGLLRVVAHARRAFLVDTPPGRQRVGALAHDLDPG